MIHQSGDQQNSGNKTKRNKTMIRTAMSRGVLVVDENVNTLVDALREHNFRVLQPVPGASDDFIVQHLLPGRSIVTNNLADFEDDVEAFEYGIIYVTQDTLADPEATAQRISRAYSHFALKHSAPFILTIGVESTTLKRFD